MPERAEATPSGHLRPVTEFDPIVQDVGDVLYNLDPQADAARYIDFAQRLMSALFADDLVIVRRTGRA